MGLNEQQAVPVEGGGIGHKLGVFRLQHLETAGRLLHLHKETGLLLPQERRHAHHVHHLLAIGAAAQAAHQPFGATALDAGSRGEDSFRH